MRVASLVPGGIENRVSGDPQATAILTNLDIIESDISVIIPEEVDELYQDECGSYAGALVKAKSGRPIFIISCHLPWGGERESRRLFHIKHINSFIMSALAKFPSDTICILAGDFNTTPISDSLRFLRGELSDETNASFWVDVWDVNEHGPGNTFDPKSGNTSLFRTAFESGIRHPEQMPPRRLDYILIKGWVYGRPGSPMGAQIMGTKPGKTGVYASDHFGLKALLWDPSG
jgi:endonuclease/exonuclease/phosphatase family metal-dependent hydrolase